MNPGGTSEVNTIEAFRDLKRWRVQLETDHKLWHQHGTLLANKLDDAGLILVGESGTGKSNVARRLLQSGEWELISNDYIEFSADAETRALYAGFKFSNSPDVFWYRDETGTEIPLLDHTDRRKWVKVARIACFGKENDVRHPGDYTFAQGGRWQPFRPLIESTVPGLFDALTEMVRIPKITSAGTFERIANQVQTQFPKAELSTRDRDQLGELDNLYDRFQLRKAAGFLFRNSGKAAIILFGSGLERRQLLQQVGEERQGAREYPEPKIRGWLRSTFGTDLLGWTWEQGIRAPTVIIDRGSALVNASTSDETVDIVEAQLIVKAGDRYLPDERLMLEELEKQDDRHYIILEGVHTLNRTASATSSGRG